MTECPLPDDGFPRITSEGVRLLQAGLTGDFTGWVKRPANHPMEIPSEHVRNCGFHANPESMHFIATVWFGPYPRLDGECMAPHIEFDAIDLKEIYVPQLPTIRLYRKGKWGFRCGVLIAVDDRGIGTRETTRFDTASVPMEPESDDDPMDSVEEPTECESCKDPNLRRTALEEWI